MKFTESHEWIKLDENIGIVGITNFAQNELGEIVYIELPDIGSEISAGSEVCVLESTKAASDVYSPVSGKIIEINEQLLKQSELVNESAENQGWLFKVELDNPNEYKSLLTLEEYQNLID
jgi:glycine cleavage system H protein